MMRLGPQAQLVLDSRLTVPEKVCRNLRVVMGFPESGTLYLNASRPHKNEIFGESK